MATDDSLSQTGSSPTLGGLVRAWRRQLFLTQEQLAARTGLAIRTIRRLESGAIRRPHSGSLLLLADGLQLTAAERQQLVSAARDTDTATTPRQLPADIAAFAGRRDPLSRLAAVLAADSRPTAVAVVISGMAGIGKTALAVHAAHQIAHHFRDGQLYVNLRGFDPSGTPMAATEVLRGFLDALGVPTHRVPADLHAQAGLYRSLVATRQVLVVLDNAGSAEQIRPLLPGGSGCLALITSRHNLSGLLTGGSAFSIALDLLSTSEATELLTLRLGHGRVAAEPDAVDDIIHSCARLPLALAIAAARAVARPDFPLAAIAGELRDAAGLGAFDSHDPATNLRSVFSWSYRTIGADSARLLRWLGLHAGPDIGVAAAASLAGSPIARTGGMLAELVRGNLVAERAPGRYQVHDLIRVYAAELASAHDPDTDRHAAARRLLDSYLTTAVGAARHLNRHRVPIKPIRAEAGVTVGRIANAKQAMAWFATEHAALIAAIALARREGLDGHAWQLAWTLVDFLDRQGHWRDWVATQRAALRSARKVDDRAGQAHCHRGLGRALARTGRYGHAYAHLHHALELFDGPDDQASRARTHLDLSWLLDLQGRDREALDHAHQALSLYLATEDQNGQARALNAVGWDYARAGQHEHALDYCRRALALHRRIGDRAGEAATWDSLGFIHLRLGRFRRAATSYQRALTLYRNLGDRLNSAGELDNIGDVHSAAGDQEAAATAWREAADILADLDHPRIDRVRAKLKRSLREQAPPGHIRGRAGPTVFDG